MGKTGFIISMVMEAAKFIFRDCDRGEFSDYFESLRLRLTQAGDAAQ